MSYLEKRPWEKAKFSPGAKGIRKVNLWKNLRPLAITFAAFLLVGIVTGNHLLQHTGTYFDPYKGVTGVAYAAAPGTVKNFRITKRQNFLNFVNGTFPLGNTISIVSPGNGEKLGTDLDGVRFAGYNTAMSYLKFPAPDWIYQSRLLKDGKKMTEVMGSENLAMAFEVVPYRQFASVTKNVHGTQSHMMEPFLTLGSMQGLEKGFERLCADGKTRTIKPNDTWLCLRPNTHGMWRKNYIDLELGAPALEPEESLPVALYTFGSDEICNHETGEWNIPLAQWIAAMNYLISYGVPVNPEEIEVVGKGIQAKFVYTGELAVDMVVVRWAENQLDPKWQFSEEDEIVDVPVSLVNSKGELCFWGSRQPDQSIVIPFSYLFRMEKDDPILLADGKVDITMQDILDEIQQVRENRHGASQRIAASDANTVRPNFGYDFSCYVTKTTRLTQIADKIIGDAQTKEEAVTRLMAFETEYLPYVSDHNGNKNKAGYNGPTEIPMSPLVALMNRGEDCEGHAIWGAASFFASEHPTLKVINKVCALASLDYSGIGHGMPLLPNVWMDLETDPFPNNVIFNVNGKDVVFAWFEPTGLGYNDLHQSRPQQRGYLPEYAMVIQGVGASRRVEMIGFNQFRYVQNIAPRQG